MLFKYWLDYYSKFTGLDEPLKGIGICLYTPQLDKISDKIRETFDERLNRSINEETYNIRN